LKNAAFLVFTIILIVFSTVPASAAVKKTDRKWQDESIYYIMVDRFNDGDSKNAPDVDTKNPLAYNGGDFQGIIDKLDYIKDMGFTSIDLTPIFDNGGKSYDGYSVQNYYKTDAHFGSIKTFNKLVKEAHKRHIKIIIDFIANSVAPTHPWVNDPKKQNWFHPKQQENVSSTSQQVLENSWIDGQPDLNQENPEVTNYLVNAAKWWIKETNIDGYQLVAANFVPPAFWTTFSKAVKSVKNGFYLLGDIQSDDPNVVNLYKSTGMDGFTDTKLNMDLRKGFAATDLSLNQLFSDWENTKQNALNPYLMGTYLDNPQSARFTNDIVSNKQYPGSRWEMALTYLYTTPGIPVIYYGSEIALNGGKAPDNHRQMNFRANKDLIDYITKLGQLRTQLPSLTRGTFEKLYEKNGMIVYKRVYQNETSVIAINNTSKSQKVTLSSKQLEDGKELRGLLNGDVATSNQHQYKIILDRDNAEIYVLADKSGINIPLFAAITAVYIAFFFFLYFIFKRRKQKR
jgi:alpha-amylase